MRVRLFFGGMEGLKFVTEVTLKSINHESTGHPSKVDSGGGGIADVPWSSC